MLNMNFDVTTAADVRFGSGMGVFPLSSVRTVPSSTVSSSTEAVLARPRAPWAADVLGRQRFTAQHMLGRHVAPKQDSIQHYYAPKTRIAAASGGVPGAHPAREPV
jgi:hypothetical protein